MRRNIADAFGLPVDAVSVKATTEEHLASPARALGIAAHAVALTRVILVSLPAGAGHVRPLHLF